MEEIYDVIIVGAGPAGCAAALYASRAKMKTLLLDKVSVGGPLARAKKVANYPGITGEVAGLELLSILRQQAVSFGARFVRAQVLSGSLEEETKELMTTEGVYKGKTVIIASGSEERHNRFSGEMEFLGRGVSYCSPCDAPFFKDEEVAVIGFDDATAEAALFATRFARKVYLVCPVAELQVVPENLKAIQDEPKVEVLGGFRLKEIKGQEGVESIVLVGRDGEREVKVTGVFIYLGGCHPATGFLDSAIKLHEKGYILVDPADMSTSVSGVYAAGDVRWYELKQAVLAAADGAIAALAADKYIHRRERLVSQHGAR